MFFFCIFLSIIILVTIVVIFTTIQIHIQNIKYSTDKINGTKLNKHYKITIKLYLLEKINYFKIDITKNRAEKQVIKENISKLKTDIIKDKNNFNLKALKAIKYLKFEIKKINLKINIGLKDAAKLAILVGGISGIIGGFLPKFIEEKAKWKIIPIYQNRNLINIDLDCIISLKMIHIIYTIYNLKKETSLEKTKEKAKKLNLFS